MSTLAFVGVVVVFWLACSTAVIRIFAQCCPYPPEAPDVEFERARPLTEVGPLVVAGSDLDRAHQPMALVNLTLRLMVDADPELAAMSSRAETLAGLYVAPEVDR